MKMTFPRWKVEGNSNLLKLAPNFSEQPEAMDLLTQMMQLEPSKRISVKAAMAHPFFADIHDDSNFIPAKVEPLVTPVLGRRVQME